MAERIETLCQQLTAENYDLSRLIQGLFSLHLKMVMLEKASERFSVSPTYFNSTLFLNARLTQPVTQKSGTGVMEAFELDIYASEYNELAFTLHKRKFLVEPEDEMLLSWTIPACGLTSIIVGLKPGANLMPVIANWIFS